MAMEMIDLDWWDNVISYSLAACLSYELTVHACKIDLMSPDIKTRLLEKGRGVKFW